ncbi:MAG: hypothetical protein F2534_08825 [Actinobacteria bacterium]|uniref:Unannotated protein n=1 Tax=freshwater metagenome TaxID=449393 RepID=A0A6J6DD22_9ZZZZ|nr:hypothetical protein [Actinomycetota bacterium]
MVLATPRAGSRALLPALVLLVVAHGILILTRSYQPGGDWAFIELRTRDVFSSDTPLTGAWSRYGWNHPGPVLYHSLALPWLASGGSWRGLWAGAMLINLAAIAVAWWTASRRSGAWAAVLVVAACWTIAAATPHLLTDPWNASVVVLPVLTVAAGVAALRGGDRRGVAVVLVMFVLVAQTHAAYALMLLPGVLVSVVAGLRVWRRWTFGWLGAAASLCLPVLVDALVNRPGNLWRALRFTATSDEPVVSIGQVLRTLGRASSLEFLASPGMPSFAAEVVDGTPWGVAPFAAFVAAGVAWRVARTRGWSPWCHALEAVALLWLGGALMTWRTRGPLLVWLTTWTVAVAVLTWCVVAAVAVQWLTARFSPTDVPESSGDGEGATADRVATRAVVAVAAVVSMVFALVNVVGSVGSRYPFQELTPVVAQFAAAAGDHVVQPTPIDLAGPSYEAGAVQSALISRLEAHGRRPLGRPDQALQLGSHRVAADLDGRRLLVRVEPRSSVPLGAEAISTWDPLTTVERAEADGLIDSLTRLLSSMGLDDRLPLLDNAQAPLAAFDAPSAVTDRRAEFERLGELHSAGPRIVLYLVEPPR